MRKHWVTKFTMSYERHFDASCRLFMGYFVQITKMSKRRMRENRSNLKKVKTLVSKILLKHGHWSTQHKHFINRLILTVLSSSWNFILMFFRKYVKIKLSSAFTSLSCSCSFIHVYSSKVSESKQQNKQISMYVGNRQTKEKDLFHFEIILFVKANTREQWEKYWGGGQTRKTTLQK